MMAVFSHENGVVTQIWRDVKTVAEFVDKYGESLSVHEGDATPGMLWDGQALSSPETVPSIGQLRANASMPRARFILAALDAGILSETDAEQAVNGWPAGWDAFFKGLPARARIAAKAEWASITTVRRDAPLIEQLRIFKGLTEEQIDEMFGID